ncbi:MAG: ATP-binding domain-containing protein [Cyclobacteriaceae bacterium]|nr:ATP-binding domain-containing protein [Cyclobacteriaceae bacterium]
MPQYYFNLPTFETLTDAQRTAVLAPGAIALSGGPGTGKSVVSLWRHILNHTKAKPLKSQLLTFTKTLAFYLKSCCKTQNADAAEFVESSLRWLTSYAAQRPEIIIDEAQDLPLQTNLRFKNFSQRVSYGADDQQILQSNARLPDRTFNLDKCSSEASLAREFRNDPHRLTRNFRSTQRIMMFAKQFFDEAFVHQDIINSLSTRVGTKPRLLISNGDIQKQNRAIIDIVRQFSTSADVNTAVLLPFENFSSANYNVRYYYSLLQNANFDCSMYTNEMGYIGDIRNIHVTTFKSAKGLEFDVVIIPNFQSAKETFRVVSYSDFFVGVTRAKSTLILMSNTDLTDIQNNLIDKVIL